MTSTLVLRLHRQLFAKRAVTWAIYQILPLNEQFCSASATSIWKWNHQTKDCVKYRKPCIRKSRNQSIKSVGMSLPSWCFLLFQMTKNVEWLLVIWYYINFQETVAKKSRSTKKQYDNSREVCGMYQMMQCLMQFIGSNCSDKHNWNENQTLKSNIFKILQKFEVSHFQETVILHWKKNPLFTW